MGMTNVPEKIRRASRRFIAIAPNRVNQFSGLILWKRLAASEETNKTQKSSRRKVDLHNNGENNKQTQ